ncbi:MULTISPECIES: hypothetical protein [Streptomycetaceae]|uniref:Uncharacterized protein n=1 Tax=Streptantibioticus cattleyicolor (strain ATCC 35852 / DSM 46488 / JCM 4925 / NBRC 14057 / NRRL 8057) TaxID=1003195 RepID=F8JQS3_STREN|nr:MULTISPECIES: hypothetical protein [Streptomycetaceae]AEW92805.1 hypothetical protein SCATT_04340 [Streptantibioticus cattleyicolor NRRL 8057 = DSM 46488]MYS57564.1 hypothetical protein [Streptomyces sp. SID5468]CCB73158.1 protein of unknown function [Streptantibioticus cattleyicolor NRRL 8057 = DSM 46488]
MGDTDNYSDDNSDGSISNSDGVWATQTGNTTGDYSHWSWKKIMAAINGGAAYVEDASVDRKLKAISDPESLQEAANAFWYTEQVLKEVAEGIADQTKALTGEHGPWRGAAAQALNKAMTGLSKQVGDMANVLSGGVTGDNDVPQQLANNAQHLREAKAKIQDINYWYAQQALKIDPSLQMSNGLVEVHKLPQVVRMMTNDMLAVLQTLATHYTVTKDSVAKPTPPTDPTHNPNGYIPGSGPNIPYNAMPYPRGGLPYYGPNLPYFNKPPTGGYGNHTPNLQPYPHSPENWANAPGNGPNVPHYDSHGPGGSKDFNGLDTNPQPYGGSTDSQGPGGLHEPISAPPLSDLPGGGPGTANKSLDNPLDQTAPASYPNNSLGPDSGNLPDGGTVNPYMEKALNPDAPPALAPFPGLGKTGDAADNSKAFDKSVKPYGGNLGLDSPGAFGDHSANPADSPVSPYQGAGLPNTHGIDAPPVGDMPSLANYPHTGLSTNGPGLPSFDNVASPDSHVAGYPGDTGLTTPGMPMMPTGSRSPGLGGSESSPSDSSGLLNKEALPWNGSTSLPDALSDVTGGAGAGGPGLHLPNENVSSLGLPLDEAPTGSLPSNGVGGMPMMPMGGMGAGGPGGANNSEGTRSDASGLLHGDALPWTGSPLLPDAPSDVVAGAGAGGPGLHLPNENVSSLGLPLDEAPTGSVPSDGVGGVPGGMPMMPMGGMGAGGMRGADNSEGTRSDASGLLHGDTAPWSGTPSSESDQVTAGAGVGGPGLELPLDEALTGRVPSEGADAPGVTMPMMPMGGLTAAAGTGEREHERSDASGLLSGTTEPWSAVADTTGSATSTPHGAPPAEGHLRAPDGQGMPADIFGTGHAPATVPSAEELAAEELAAGVVAGMPLTATAGGGPGGTGGSPNHRTRPAEDSTTPAWGEGTWGTSGPSPAGVPADPSHATAHHDAASVTPSAPPPTTEHTLPAREVAAPAQPASTVPAAQHQPAPAAPAEPLDDAATWDAEDDSLLPLLGVQRSAPGHPDASDDSYRQDAAAVTSVVAGAYPIARAVAGEQEAPAAPTRQAWRPKANTTAPMELSCSFEDEPTAPTEERENRPASATTNGKGRDREEEGKKGSSISDLLRQGEEVWG